MIHAGEPAADFALPDEDGNIVRLADQRGQWVVFWWYPKASTGG